MPPAWQVYNALSRDHRATPDADGSFRFEGVREGRYRLHVSLQSGHGTATKLRFKEVVESGYPPVEHREPAVPLMQAGKSEEALSLGTLRYAMP